MNIDIGENIRQMLENLAASLGLTVQQVWPWMVKQAVLEGWMNIIIPLIGLLISGFIWYKASKHPWKKENSDPTEWGFVGFLAGISFLVVLIVLAVIIQFSICMINNPEYYALKEIMNLLPK